MGSFSDFLENEILDHVVGKGDYNMPTASVALVISSVVDADDGAAINECVSTYGYQRVVTAASDWNAASGGSITNAGAITFPTASGGAYGTVVGFALCNTSVVLTGEVLLWGDLSTSKTVGDGDTVEFAAGDLTITLD